MSDFSPPGTRGACALLYSIEALYCWIYNVGYLKKKHAIARGHKKVGTLAGHKESPLSAKCLVRISAA